MARLSYPRDALIQVRIDYQNLSRGHPLVVDTGPYFDEIERPQAEVLDDRSRIVYPGESIILAPPPLHAPIPRPMRIGERDEHFGFAILRGDRIRARLDVGLVDSQGGMTIWPLRTSSIRVRRTGELLPRVSLGHSSSGWYADFVPARTTREKLFYIDSARCQTGSATGPYSQHIFWTATSKRRLVLPCTGVQRWNINAGWLGQSVKSIRYVGH